MNLICPNCQKKLTIADQDAGQVMKCPLCSQPFSVPALPEPALAAAGSVHPSGPAFPPHSDGPEPVYAAAPFSQQNTKEAPPPPPPAGYEQTWTIWISPRLIRWVAPVALLIVLIFMFFPWTGVFPGGIAVYTQNAFQMIWGGYSVDTAGDKVLSLSKEIDAAIRANWLMFFYLLLILAAFALAAAPLVLARIAYPLPRPLQQIWPWRTILVLIATLLAFLILLSFLANGSGFENAVIAIADKGSAKEAAASLEEAIKHGLALSRLNLSRTFWLHGAVFFHFVALAGVGLELWLERRGARPLPRVEAQW
jgi:hypothetical protein